MNRMPPVPCPCRVLLLLAGLGLGLLSSARAQATLEPARIDDGLLAARIESPVVRPRPYAPLPIRVRLQWSGSRPLSGRLLLGGNSILPRVGSGVVLVDPNGTHEMRMLLPPPQLPPRSWESTVEVGFQTDDGTYRLGRMQVSAGSKASRNLVVGHVLPDADTGSNSRYLASLALERFALTGGGQSPVSTFFHRLTPEDLPSSPEALCTYDVICLGGSALQDLELSQLASLSIWVHGGGALAVQVRDELDEHREQFLDDLTRHHTADQSSLLLKCDVDLGRAVVILPGADLDGDHARAWTIAALYLWRVRPAHIARLIRTGFQPMSFPEVDKYDLPHYQQPLNSARLLRANDLGVRPPPVALVAVILLVLLTLAGPVDALVLRYLKRPIWTWITVPMLSLLFLFISLAVAAQYLGQDLHQRVLRVVDLGPEGRVLRDSRYTLRVPPKETRSSRHVEGPLVSPIPTQGAGLLSYSGRIPGDYELEQVFHQWSHHGLREFRLGAGIAPLDMDPNWDDLEPLLDGEDAAVKRAIALKMTPSTDPSRTQRSWVVNGSASRRPRNGSVEADGDWDVAQLATWNQDVGFLGLVERIAPAGGGFYGDLTLRTWDEQGRALLVAVKTQDDLTIYRRDFGE